MKTIEGATGIFLTVKGSPPSRATLCVPYSTGNPQLNAVGIMSSPAWDITAELSPLQEADPFLRELRRKAAGADPHFRLRENILYRVTTSGDRLVVPTSLQNALIEEYHDHVGHLGIARTLDRLASRFWFPAMQKTVKKYIQ